jgi:hypothetical protein
VSRLCCTKFNIHVIVASTLFSSQRQECQNINVAILHPRKLVIYTLVTSSGFAEHGNVYMSLHGTVDLTLFPEKINDIEFFDQTFVCFRPTVKIANITTARVAKVCVYHVQRKLRWSEGERVHLRHVPRQFTEVLRARRN